MIGAAPAAACSCVAPTGSQASIDRAFAKDATRVFVGTLLERTVPPRPGPVSSSGDPAVFTFEVSRVFKGDVSANQRILSAQDGATCGLIEGPGPFLIFARDQKRPAADWLVEIDRDLPWSGLCGGARPVDEGAKIALGAGTAPLPPTARPEATPTSVPRDLVGAEGTVENDEGTSGSYALFIAAAAVLAGAAVVWRLRRS